MRMSKLYYLAEYYLWDRERLANALGITARHVRNLEHHGLGRSPILKRLVDALYELKIRR